MIECTVYAAIPLAPPLYGRSHTDTPLSLFQTHSHMRLEFLPEETSHSQDEGEHGSCGSHTVVPGRVWTRSGVCVCVCDVVGLWIKVSVFSASGSPAGGRLLSPSSR